MNSQTITGNKERSAKWDNVKALMIILVVVGHFLFYVVDDSAALQRLYFFIHLFHMPVFVFLSGLFAGRTVDTGHRLAQKVVGFIVLGYLLNFVNISIKLAYGHFDKLRFFYEGGLAWYLFALAFWLLLTWLLRNFNRRALLVFSVIFALFAGYDKSIGTLLTLSRAICFYPFFLLGVLTDRRKLEQLEHGARGTAGKVLSALLLLLTALLIWRHYGGLAPYLEILKGWHTYFLLEEPAVPLHGIFYRAAWYAAAALAGGAVIWLTPARRSALSAMGSRTLQVYLLHRPVMYLLKYNGWLEWLERIWPAHWHVLYLLSAVVLAVILALPVFEIPIRWFWRTIGGIPKAEKSS